MSVDEKLREKIDEQAKTPEQAERLKTMFDTMGSIIPPSLPMNGSVEVTINMFELTVALVAAAQIVGHEVVDLSKVYLSSVKMAETFFTREGTFIERV